MATEEPPVVQNTESDCLDPWIDDGNIVLAVQGKYFRVHRSTLSFYSEVFKDMFDCTQPNEGEKSEEFIEHCPVVHLHDAAADVQIVLKAMYDRSYPLPYNQRNEKVPFSVVSALLRLGEKYIIKQFLDEAKARLFYGLERTLTAAAKMTSKTCMVFPGIADSDPHNFLVMNLMEEMNVKTNLPLAMYQCVIACPLTAILDGYQPDNSESIYSLSPANLRAWILMKNILENFRIQLAQRLNTSPYCNAPRSCVLYVHRMWSDDATVTQPFGTWRPEWDRWFCEVCKGHLKSCRDSVIQKAWDQLPTAYGFDSWREAGL